MRVTWITHLAMNDVCAFLHRQKPVSGGWLETMKEALRSNKNVELTIICIDKDKNERVCMIKEADVTYYYIGADPRNYVGKFTEFYKENLNRCIVESYPDLIHIHGTEFPVSLALRDDVIEKAPVCVSIQGLISVISGSYYWGGIREEKLSPLVRVPLWIQNRAAKRRGEWEKQILGRYQHFLGRTLWDYSHLKAVNPDARYYVSSEPVKKEFADENNQWNSLKMEKHSIFCAGGYRLPIKGFHKILTAAELLARRYPDMKIYVTGNAPNSSIRNRLGYGRYISNRIAHSDVKDRIVFTGVLNAAEMAMRFSVSNCYVLASSIENSPNTLCEAMRIGTPSIAAVVGGVQDFVKDKENGLLYRFEEVEMLAESMAYIFDNPDEANRLSGNARKAAALFDVRGSSLAEIYQMIIDEKRETTA